MSSYKQFESEDFIFSEFGESEEQIYYHPGGYHPVTLGDIISPPSHPERQYRILHKLGWGSYSTVWLAEPIERGEQTPSRRRGLVAVKISIAKDPDVSHSREGGMLEKCREGWKKMPAGGEGESGVVTLLDQFTLEGPNGTHTALVTEVLVPLLTLVPGGPRWRKSVAWGMVQAMIQIHNNGVVHGDWHLGNIGLAVPSLSDLSPAEAMAALQSPEVIVVLPKDAKDQTKTLPPYLLHSVNASRFDRTVRGFEPPVVKVFDFGHAHIIGQKMTGNGRRSAWPPDIYYARTYGGVESASADTSIDVWALGVGIFQIISGCHPFSTIDDSLHGLSKLAHAMPPEWKQWQDSLGHSVAARDVDEWWNEKRGLLRNGCQTDGETESLVRLLKRMLTFDPKQRPTLSSIAQDSWFDSVRDRGLN